MEGLFYYSVQASPVIDKLKLKLRKSWVQFLFGWFLYFFYHLQSSLCFPSMLKSRINTQEGSTSLQFITSYAFLTDNAILASHFSRQLFLGKTIKERNKSRKKTKRDLPKSSSGMRADRFSNVTCPEQKGFLTLLL